MTELRPRVGDHPLADTPRLDEVTTFAFPGDPVTGQRWREVNNGTPTPTNAPGDRRQAVSSSPFTLQPGESRTVDLAILYARGSSNLASVTALRQASDRVQAMHDDGSLYVPGLGGSLPPAPGSVALLTPADGADLGVRDSVLMDWMPALKATVYSVELAPDASFSFGVQRIDTALDSATFFPEPNVQRTTFWRVRAVNQGIEGPVSAVRRFTAYGPYRPVAEGVDERDATGAVIDPKLIASLNSATTRPPTYLVGVEGASSDDAFAVLARLNADGFLSANAPREYEIRWVDAATQGQVVLNREWNRTTPGRAFLTCVETGTVVANGAPSSLVTTPAPVVGGYPRMPFQAWEIEADGTERQVHVNVIDDDADLCYSFTTAANSGAAPLAGGGYERLFVSRVPYVESELANPAEVHARANVPDASSQAFGRMSILLRTGPARPPQAGTRIHVLTTDAYVTASETPPGETAGLALDVTRPNPVRSRAAVRFTTAAAGSVRLTVYDVLGRRVAVLAQGEQAAGPHEATLDASRLAPGVYLLVLESGGARAVRPVTVIR